MSISSVLLAEAEIWVFSMACLIMLVDLYLREERHGIIHFLAVITVIFAAIIKRAINAIPVKNTELCRTFDQNLVCH